MFFGTFSWSFVHVSLPFHIDRISPGNAASTLAWTGWILGVNPLVTMLTAPVWGRLAERGNPKTFYVVIQFLQGLGFFIMALAHTLAAPRLGELRGQRRLLGLPLVASSLFLAALGAVGSVWAYGVLRFLQVLCIAPALPLSVARIAQRVGGAALGFINSARIGAAFVGPVLATTLLGWSTPAVLYVVLAALGCACAPLVRERERGPAPGLV
jgi:MFS family permease